MQDNIFLDMESEMRISTPVDWIESPVRNLSGSMSEEAQKSKSSKRCDNRKTGEHINLNVNNRTIYIWWQEFMHYNPENIEI